MTMAADLVAETLNAGLLLSRDGQRIHVDSPLGRPLSDDLKDRLITHRGEVLAWLDWCERADELLMATSRRIATRYPIGCPLDTDEWQAVEQALHEAHGSQDLAVWRAALERYEAFATRYFTTYEREHRHA